MYIMVKTPWVNINALRSSVPQFGNPCIIYIYNHVYHTVCIYIYMIICIINNHIYIYYIMGIYMYIIYILIMNGSMGILNAQITMKIGLMIHEKTLRGRIQWFSLRRHEFCSTFRLTQVFSNNIPYVNIYLFIYLLTHIYIYHTVYIYIHIVLYIYTITQYDISNH